MARFVIRCLPNQDDGMETKDLEVVLAALRDNTLISLYVDAPSIKELDKIRKACKNNQSLKQLIRSIHNTLCWTDDKSIIIGDIRNYIQRNKKLSEYLENLTRLFKQASERDIRGFKKIH